MHTDEPTELLEPDGQGEHSFRSEPYLFQNVFAGQEQPRPVDVDPAGQGSHVFSALIQYVLGGQVQVLPAPSAPSGHDTQLLLKACQYMLGGQVQLLPAPSAPSGHDTQLLLDACQYSVDKHRLASMLSDTLFISS